jgi:hypothetical protein
MFSRGARRAFIGARLRRSLLVGVGVAAITLALAPGALASTTIDTTGDWIPQGTSFAQLGWGQFNTATFGQTVTVPATDTKLDSFTFYLDLPTELMFRGEVYAWNNSPTACGSGPCATGQALYQSPSATQTTVYNPAPGSSQDFQPITFNTGGINLAAGQQYVLFVTVSVDWTANAGIDAGCGGCLDNPGFIGGAVPNTDSYSGGDFFEIYNQNQSSDTSQWTTMPWQNFVSQGLFDSAFKASFSSPLPTSKAQCKNGGWKTYGVFKNQGDCVSFVATGGKNPPSGP